jgi:hypothetical protein
MKKDNKGLGGKGRLTVPFIIVLLQKKTITIPILPKVKMAGEDS